MKKTDASIVFSKNGSVSIEIPKIDPVPQYVLTATALVFLLSEGDKKLTKLINEKLNRLYKIAETLQKEGNKK
jgi:hypothetical protein